jgi:hypothetical protein
VLLPLLSYHPPLIFSLADATISHARLGLWDPFSYLQLIPPPLYHLRRLTAHLTAIFEPLRSPGPVFVFFYKYTDKIINNQCKVKKINLIGRRDTSSLALTVDDELVCILSLFKLVYLSVQVGVSSSTCQILHDREKQAKTVLAMSPKDVLLVIQIIPHISVTSPTPLQQLGHVWGTRGSPGP